ncbi:MAG: MarR family transcriptional regulator [Acidobacteriota bacterium]
MALLSKQDYQAHANFRYAIRRFLRTSEKNARAAGITPQQYQLLLTIKGTEGRDWATISEVAESLQILHHAAVGLCIRAEQSGLIAKAPNNADRRQVCLVLTDKGEHILTHVAIANRRELQNIREDILQLFLAM